MNTCPVYRRSGGHSYNAVVPGPIGSILEPARDPARHASLPHACSLCGSCSDVCPVKINIHEQLLIWRRELAQQKLLPFTKRIAMTLTSALFQRPRLYAFAGKMGRMALRVLPRFMVYNRLNPWGRQRELPPAPPQSFRELYQIRHGR